MCADVVRWWHCFTSVAEGLPARIVQSGMHTLGTSSAVGRTGSRWRRSQRGRSIHAHFDPKMHCQELASSDS
jgi:hypothetical protein